MLKKIAIAVILIATGAGAANVTTNRKVKKLATNEFTPFSVGVPDKPLHYLWVEMKADPNYYQQTNIPN
jgi:hypothetical protein